MTKRRSGVRSTQMRNFCCHLVSTPSAYSDGYPILKTEFGSKSVRGRKKRKKARNHAVRKAVTPTQTSRRRRLSISVFEGPDEASPAAAAAFEVPTAGVPTYFVASTAGLAAGFAASGFGLTFSASGSAMCPLLLLCDLAGETPAGQPARGRRYQPSPPRPNPSPSAGSAFGGTKLPESPARSVPTPE